MGGWHGLGCGFGGFGSGDGLQGMATRADINISTNAPREG